MLQLELEEAVYEPEFEERDDSVRPLSAIQSHINDMERYEYGDEQEQLALALRAKRGDAKARAQLILNNWRISWWIARKYRCTGLELSDLIQWGHVGLCRAVDEFDPTKGFRFFTYAQWWVRHYIKRGVEMQDRTIRIPSWVVESKALLEALEEQYRQAHKGKLPTPDELAKAMGVDVLTISAMLNGQLRSTDEAPIGVSEDVTYEDALSDPAASSKMQDVWHDAVMEAPVERLKTAVTSLPLRHRHVLEKRIGVHFRGDSLELQEPTILEDIGKELGVSRERARQIEKEAAERVRSWMAQNDPTLKIDFERALKTQGVAA